MVSIERRMAFAHSSLFIAMLGLLLYIEVWKLLLYYLPGNDDAYERDADDHTDERYQRRRHAQKRRHRSDGFDRFREETEEEFARLIDLKSQITSSEQQPQHQDRQWRQRDEWPEQQGVSSPLPIFILQYILGVFRRCEIQTVVFLPCAKGGGDVHGPLLLDSGASSRIKI